MDATSSNSSIFIAPNRAPRPSGLSRSAAPKPAPIVVQDNNLRPKEEPVISIDTRLIAIIDSPLAAGETAMTGFARKESELGTAMALLTILEARALHARLSINKPGDVVAAKFARLTVERRNRLLSFLADARRREAIAAARR